MKELSIIIPAYNAENTLRCTLESILSSLALVPRSYEVIVVDDCSSDGTVLVAESFSGSIDNLKVLKMASNKRQGTARNRGLEVAEGRYVMFVDSDDLVLEGINTALALAAGSDADICLYPIICESEDELWDMDGISEFVKSGEEFCERMFNSSCKMLLTPCSGLYRMELIRKVGYSFVEGHRAEDTDFALKYLSSAGRISYCPSASYRYVNNPKSTVNTRDWDILFDYLLLAERLVDVSESVESRLPSFSASVRMKVVPIALNRLSLWFIGKLNFKGVFSFYENFGSERRRQVCTGGVVGFPVIVLKHKWLSICIIAVYKCFIAVFRRNGRNV